MDKDESLLPIGTILPFKPGQISPGWQALDGTTLDRAEHQELWNRLSSEEMTEIWKDFVGGDLTEDSIVLPNVAERNVHAMLGWPAQMSSMVLAIRVART